jgi:hypothetical protein
VVAPKVAVKLPSKTIRNEAEVFNENNNDNFIVKNTPAVTMVAACIKAETGVGPSIASGNHIWKPNWADLPEAAKSTQTPTNLIR